MTLAVITTFASFRFVLGRLGYNRTLVEAKYVFVPVFQPMQQTYINELGAGNNRSASSAIESSWRTSVAIYNNNTKYNVHNYMLFRFKLVIMAYRLNQSISEYYERRLKLQNLCSSS